MSDDDETPEVESESPGYVPVTQALEMSLFTVVQLRALVTAGIVKTSKGHRGVTLYCVEDLRRFEGMPRAADEPAEHSPLIAELGAITAGYRSMLELALKQTKQAQDHERLLVSAFSKPLEQLGEGSKALVGAVLEQNKQLVTRATDGDNARLDFVKAAETLLRDQRTELREQAELDRQHELRREMWDGVKRAAPHLLEGFKKTTGADALEAAAKLKEKLSPDKVAALVAFKLLDDEELDLLCRAFGYDRTDLEKRAAEANAVKAADDEHDAAQPEAAE